MKWTTERPTVPGWYWMRGPEMKQPTILSHALSTGPIEEYAATLEYFGSNFGRPLEYAGPIPLPDEQLEPAKI